MLAGRGLDNGEGIGEVQQLEEFKRVPIECVMGSSRAELKVLEGDIDFVLSSNEGNSGLNEFVGKS